MTDDSDPLLCISIINANPDGKYSNGSTKRIITSLQRGLKNHKKPNMTRVIHLVEYTDLMPSFNSRYWRGEVAPPAIAKKCLKDVLADDAQIYIMPTHWYGCGDVMAKLIAWLTLIEEQKFALQGRAVGAISTFDTDGGFQVASTLRSVLEQMGGYPIQDAILAYNKHLVRRERWMAADLSVLPARIIEALDVLSFLNIKKKEVAFSTRNAA